MLGAEGGDVKLTQKDRIRMLSKIFEIFSGTVEGGQKVKHVTVRKIKITKISSKCRRIEVAGQK